MSATQAIRACVACGVSIADRAPQATTCGATCRSAKRNGTNPARTCSCCRKPLPRGREHRNYCSDSCHKAALANAVIRQGSLANSHPAPVSDHPARRVPKCKHRQITFLDQDGDTVCLHCGTLVEHTGHINGFDDLRWAMETDADGLYHRPPRKVVGGCKGNPRRPVSRRVRYAELDAPSAAQESA